MSQFYEPNLNSNLQPIFRDQDCKNWSNLVFLVPDFLAQSFDYNYQKINSTLLDLAWRKNISTSSPIFRKCSSSNKILQVCNFPIKNKDQKLSWASSREVANQQKQMRRAKLFEQNIQIIRMMMHGNPATALHCLKSGVALENRLFNDPYQNKQMSKHIFELHHILTYNNESVHKLSKRLQPSDILKDYDLLDPAKCHLLIDLMGTIAISQDEHKLVHYLAHSDGEFWQTNQASLPWIWKNKSNFDHFCSSYGLALCYQKFMFCHSLKWIESHGVPAPLDHTQAEHCKIFIKRFE